jgi:hypothetical protein
MAYKSNFSKEEKARAYRMRGKSAKDKYGNRVGYYDMNGEIVYFGRGGY